MTSTGTYNIAKILTPLRFFTFIHKEYKLPFASMGLKEDLRDIKNNKEFVSKREEILSMIWDMEEEIMGKEV